jgi:hypothetical protein
MPLPAASGTDREDEIMASRKPKRELDGRSVKETKQIPPVAAEIRKAHQAANACPVHKPCNPLKYCADRAGAH